MVSQGDLTMVLIIALHVLCNYFEDEKKKGERERCACMYVCVSKTYLAPSLKNLYIQVTAVSSIDEKKLIYKP